MIHPKSVLIFLLSVCLYHVMISTLVLPFGFRSVNICLPRPSFNTLLIRSSICAFPSNSCHLGIPSWSSFNTSSFCQTTYYRIRQYNLVGFVYYLVNVHKLAASWYQNVNFIFAHLIIIFPNRFHSFRLS